MTILFLNHKQIRCGVYQYGYRVGDILSKSKKHNFIYREVESADEYINLIEAIKPNGIIYNHHAATMPWLTNEHLIRFTNIVHYKLHHESGSPNFKYTITQDPTTQITDTLFPTPRPLFEGLVLENQINDIPIIGSFGFGFTNKGFARLCQIVNEQFDNAIIKLHITSAYFGDNAGTIANSVIESCKAQITKPGIQLIITNNFLSNLDILNFLASNTINVFLYDEMSTSRGISSVIDYALSVNRPIAITKTHMFRHIKNTTPSICVEENTLNDIITTGAGILDQYRQLWSNENLITTYENMIDKTI